MRRGWLLGQNAPIFRLGLGLAAVLVASVFVHSLRADTILIGGTINQSIQDGTGPAVNNPALNNIQDGDAYTIDLTFGGAIAAAGTFDLTGSSLSFSVAGLGVAEDGFNAVSLTVTQSGDTAQFSLLACLASGSGCNQGNELDLSFQIPFANLNSQNAGAQAIPGLLPLDLLEDDGVTDIHGLVTNYSYPSAAAVPEPPALALMGAGFIALGLKRWMRR